jgi:glycosyltransferase involved in cell wall biosynthesis
VPTLQLSINYQLIYAPIPIMKMAFVADGYIPIPPVSSSILNLIGEYKDRSEQNGHQVDIFNRRDVRQVIDEINHGDYDFVHLHAGSLVEQFNQYLQQDFCFTSHAGHLLKKNEWDNAFKLEFQSYLNAPGIIALSPVSQQLFLDAGYGGYIATQVNGIDTQKVNRQPQGNGKAICLGWIQPRKQQRLLANTLDGKIEIDFVGPLDDPDFKEGVTTKYLGTWSLADVYQRLTEYSCLVLISNGEVAPLVVLEAMAAGLCIVVSESASANLHIKDFIKVLPDQILTGATPTHQQLVCESISELIERNQSSRSEIVAYVKENFDFSQIVTNYDRIVTEFINLSRS